MSAPDAQRRGALAAYRDGRVQLLHVTCRKTAHEVDEVVARVRSSREGGPVYAVDLLGGTWLCTCARGGDCAHVYAVRQATGHNPAAPQTPAGGPAPRTPAGTSPLPPT